MELREFKGYIGPDESNWVAVVPCAPMAAQDISPQDVKLKIESMMGSYYEGLIEDREQGYDISRIVNRPPLLSFLIKYWCVRLALKLVPALTPYELITISVYMPS